MAASPEFYRPSPAPSFSPLPPAAAPPVPDDTCRTPTGCRISYLREPTTCPPAPRKAPPPPCKKRLFHHQEKEQEQEGGSEVRVPLISLRLDDLHRIFRPHQQPTPDKRRRRRSSSSSSSVTKQQQRDLDLGLGDSGLEAPLPPPLGA